MSAIISVGRQFIPVENVTLVEPFDPAANPEFKTSREFKSRIVLRSRVSLLTEDAPQAFVETHGFRWLDEDKVATNPRIPFRVETFASTERFAPAKPYQTRLTWQDETGSDQSKLLVTKPETVIAIAVRGEPAAATVTGGVARRSRASRRRRNGAAPRLAP
jgi:hypothetical protein